jgi:hypothetical protein
LVGFDEFVDERRGGGVESSVGIEREFFELFFLKDRKSFFLLFWY